jgi:uncharacterized protein (UPF0332 family)
MVAPLDNDLLVLLTQAKKNKFDDLKLGVTLEKKSGHSIDELREHAIRDRLRFAQQILNTTKKIAKIHSKEHRLTTVRSYYALYHAARALVYFCEGGDDHEEHSKVATKLPNDLPEKETWQNRLKTARLDRNRADYEPYPTKLKEFAATARLTLQYADEFIRVVKRYLKKKGCAL